MAVPAAQSNRGADTVSPFQHSIGYFDDGRSVILQKRVNTLKQLQLGLIPLQNTLHLHHFLGFDEAGLDAVGLAAEHHHTIVLVIHTVQKKLGAVANGGLEPQLADAGRIGIEIELGQQFWVAPIYFVQCIYHTAAADAGKIDGGPIAQFVRKQGLIHLQVGWGRLGSLFASGKAAEG
jgi:hypothetical protein